MITEAILRCPHCQAATPEGMPPAHSQMSFICSGCGRESAAEAKDCCVFCKYSDQFCPPQQNRRNGCCA